MRRSVGWALGNVNAERPSCGDPGAALWHNILNNNRLTGTPKAGQVGDCTDQQPHGRKTPAASIDQVWSYHSLQPLDEFRLHEVVIIRNVETNHLLPNQCFPVLFPQATEVFLLHDEYQVCPTQMTRRDSDPSSRLRAGRTCLNAIYPMKYSFRSGTAPAVAAAEE